MDEKMTDETVNYQSGKVAAVFNIGTKVEALQETYDAEAQTFHSMKAGLALAASALISYKDQMINEMKISNLPIKEVEFGKMYVNRCIDIVQKIFNDTEAKRLQALGAAEALKRLVESTKKTYDSEKIKLDTYSEYSLTEQEPRDRPVGYPPRKKLKKNA